MQNPEIFKELVFEFSQDYFKQEETSYPVFNPYKLNLFYLNERAKDSSDYFGSKKNASDLDSFCQFESEQKPLTLIKNDECAKNVTPKFFITNIKANRGRKSNLLGLKTQRKRKNHTKSAFDNILTKIQCHFFNFFISLANDAIKSILVGNKLTFKPINYKCKKRVSYYYFNGLKEMKINQLLHEEISGKYKSDKYINQEIYMKLIPLSNWLADFFNMKYLKLFSIYYNKLKPLKKVTFQSKVITLSSKTKSFYYLLRKNKEIKDIIISTAKDAYFNGQEDYSDKFLVKKIDDDKEKNEKKSN